MKMLSLMCCALCVLIASGVRVLGACGLRWSEPKSFFDGVDYQGNVFLVKELGSIKISQTLHVPFRVIFSSKPEAGSELIGYGWSIPLLESRIVQMDEKWFRVYEPTGWERYFWRDGESSHVLHGQGGWKGVMDGDIIKVFSPCGNQMTFTKGKLTEFKTEGQDFKLKAGITSAVELIADDLGSVRVGLQSDGVVITDNAGKNFEFELKELRPVIGRIANGNRAVVDQRRVLSAIAVEGDAVTSYGYGATDLLDEVLTIDGQRKLTWDGETKKIKSNGDWDYEITPPVNFRSNAEIRRIKAGFEEYWFNDRDAGVESVKFIDGTTIRKFWNISGPLANKLRAVVVERGKEKLGQYQYAYDAEGRIKRVRNTLLKTENLGGKLGAMGVSAIPWSVEYDEDGAVKTIANSQRTVHRIGRGSGEFEKFSNFLEHFGVANQITTVEVIAEKGGDKRLRLYKDKEVVRYVSEEKNIYHKINGKWVVYGKVDEQHWLSIFQVLK